MAQQDKTDWYWNGVLAGAVNNLYYDFINVDVTHVPYTATHRNSSFFLKNRLSYIPSDMWKGEDEGWDVTDAKVIWENKCDKSKGTVYALAANPFRTKGRIYKWDIVDGCVDATSRRYDEFDTVGCGDWKLFVTDYVKGPIVENIIDGDCPVYGYTGIQINEYEGGTTHGYFSDECIEEGDARFRTTLKGYFLLVYDSKNGEDSGFAGQVRLITDVDSKGRLVLNAPWQGFKTLSSDSEEKEVKGDGVKYYIFKDWGEVVGYSTGKKIYVVTNVDNGGFSRVAPYSQISPYLDTNIIGVASAANKIFVLTDNGWIHYTNTTGGYDKFFIQEDMFAGIDKTSITSYRDFVVVFGKQHLGICVPEEGNMYKVYNQSQTVGLWSRYSFGEYDGDLLFVSNDKRLLALGVASNTGSYMLQYEDVGGSSAFNSKLSTLTGGDEVFVGDDRGDLRVFVNYHSNPYIPTNPMALHPEYVKKSDGGNTATHIYKFDKLFKVWTEDHLSGFCMWGVTDGLYFGEAGIYVRDAGGVDMKYGAPYNMDIVSKISAYLIENESDWIGGTSSRLANRPKLYNLAKLNRLITILGPGHYGEDVKIHITSYVNGIGTEYEFPVGMPGDEVNNFWVKQMSDNYIGDDTEIAECQLELIKDNQTGYKANCTSSKITPYSVMQDKPWCDSYKEILLPSHGVCIDDSLYRLAPTMPLVTNLGENQSYATQIKLELVSRNADITFGGWLGEMFIAPLFTIGPDGEYQLQPQSDC